MVNAPAMVKLTQGPFLDMMVFTKKCHKYWHKILEMWLDTDGKFDQELKVLYDHLIFFTQKLMKAMLHNSLSMKVNTILHCPSLF